MATELEQLKQFTTVVADTGDFQSIREYAPQDATTNPTLILKAAQQSEYQSILDKAVNDIKQSGASSGEMVSEVLDYLLILFGLEILKIIPGRVSTETDAKLSFNTDALVQKAHKFIKLYEKYGIAKERILIKIATTWEGIEAARILQKEGINCNMTLLFSMPQAVACAEAGAKLISPFVGRILDWYKAKTGETYSGANDPGVESVKGIYQYYKKFGHATEVMGASFRNADEIRELAGCDLLTISPGLLNELNSSSDKLDRKLDPASASDCELEKITIDEKSFRWLFNENAMATEKTAEGIRNFAKDTVSLEKLIEEKL